MKSPAEPIDPDDGPALGLVEATSLVVLVVACDAALKAAAVVPRHLERMGCAMITAVFTGRLADVQVAMNAAQAAGVTLGKQVRVRVLPRADASLPDHLPLRRTQADTTFLCHC